MVGVVGAVPLSLFYSMGARSMPQCFEENNVFRIVIIVGWASQILKPAIIIDLFQ